MLVLAGLLAAAAVAEPRKESSAGFGGLHRFLVEDVEAEAPRFHRDTADSVLADGEEEGSAARSSAGRIGLAYIIIVSITVAALQLALLESRKKLGSRLAVSHPITVLALLVFLVHVVRGNGFGSTA
jgi:hypothetical protein